jgi:hypothetical protein
MTVSAHRKKYKVYHAGLDFVLDGKPAPGHPMVLHPLGIIFLPVADYLHERAVFQNAAHGTILGEAYILCAWLNFLHTKGLGWKDASDELIKMHAQALTDKGVKNPRVQLCADLIFQFYWLARTVWVSLRGSLKIRQME